LLFELLEIYNQIGQIEDIGKRLETAMDRALVVISKRKSAKHEICDFAGLRGVPEKIMKRVIKLLGENGEFKKLYNMYNQKRVPSQLVPIIRNAMINAIKVLGERNDLEQLEKITEFKKSPHFSNDRMFENFRIQ